MQVSAHVCRHGHNYISHIYSEQASPTAELAADLQLDAGCLVIVKKNGGHNHIGHKYIHAMTIKAITA